MAIVNHCSTATALQPCLWCGLAERSPCPLGKGQYGPCQEPSGAGSAPNVWPLEGECGQPGPSKSVKNTAGRGSVPSRSTGAKSIRVKTS